MIVSYVQTKGGTGKSTLALNTAFSRTMIKKFASIALVELDPQGTLQNWWRERGEEPREAEKVSFHHISSSQKEVLQNSIRAIADHNELLVIDIPGESTGKLHTRFACAFSDLVIIPMRTSTNDESAFAENLLPLIRDIVKLDARRTRCFYILPSFNHPRSRKDNIVGYFKDILPHPVQCLDAVYPARAIYENFNRDGLNLDEYAASISKNRRLRSQAEKALEDIEEISRKIIDNLEG